MEHRALRLRNPRRAGRLPEQLFFRCRMVNDQVSWCRMLCKPHKGLGRCGRLAPHELRSEHHKAMTAFKERREAENLSKP